MIAEVLGMRLPKGYDVVYLGDVYVLVDQANSEVEVFGEGFDPAYVEDAAWEDRLRDANDRTEDVAAALDSLLSEAGVTPERRAYWHERFDRAVFWSNFEALECFESASTEGMEEPDADEPCVYVVEDGRRERYESATGDNGFLARFRSILAERSGLCGLRGFRLW